MEHIRGSEEFKGLFVSGSWQETLTAQCKSKLAVKPKKTRAVLFYSQLPDGWYLW